MVEKTTLIPPHGGFRKLKSFQLSQLVYDLTVLFCDRYVNKRSRTHDQMVQAARSGVQNIAEGSQASGTSKKTELKLTNVARASLEELRLDYEDHLRQRGLPILEPDHPVLCRFKEQRCATVEAVRGWVERERKREGERTQTNTDEHRRTRTGEKEKTGSSSVSSNVSVSVRESPCSSVIPDSSVIPLSSQALAANAILSLLNLCCHLLDRQLAVQAAAFEKEGGFTERLYRTRRSAREK